MPQVLTVHSPQANALAPGWGQVIFQSANEIANNQLAKQRMAEIQAQLPQEKEWWDKRKQTIQSDFMKELDEDEEKSKAGGSRQGSVVSNPQQKTNSDDDAVLVEAGGPAAETQGQTPGSAKKKRNNKK